MIDMLGSKLSISVNFMHAYVQFCPWEPPGEHHLKEASGVRIRISHIPRLLELSVHVPFPSTSNASTSGAISRDYASLFAITHKLPPFQCPFLQTPPGLFQSEVFIEVLMYFLNI